MKGWGKFLIVVGLICAFSAITMDTSVATDLGGRVNNLGLMNLQTNLLISAGISFISGILLIGFSSKSEVSSSEAVRICPYCAEQVKAQATICRFCQKDLPALNNNNENVVCKNIFEGSKDKYCGICIYYKYHSFSGYQCDFHKQKVQISQVCNNWVSCVIRT